MPILEVTFVADYNNFTVFFRGKHASMQDAICNGRCLDEAGARMFKGKCAKIKHHKLGDDIHMIRNQLSTNRGYFLALLILFLLEPVGHGSTVTRSIDSRGADVGCVPIELKKTLIIIAAGLQAVGKTTVLGALARCFKNVIWIDQKKQKTSLQSLLKSRVMRHKRPMLWIFDGDYAKPLQSKSFGLWLSSSPLRTEVVLFISGIQTIHLRMQMRGSEEDKKKL